MGRIKSIIMDVAPSGGTLRMGADLGYTVAEYDILANDVNAEFGTNINGNDLQPFNSVSEVVAYIESQLP